MKKGLLQGDWFDNIRTRDRVRNIARDGKALARDVHAMRGSTEKFLTREYTNHYGVSPVEVNVDVDMAPVVSAIEHGADGIREDLAGIGGELTLIRGGTEDIQGDVGDIRAAVGTSVIIQALSGLGIGAGVLIAGGIWDELKKASVESIRHHRVAEAQVRAVQKTLKVWRREAHRDHLRLMELNYQLGIRIVGELREGVERTALAIEMASERDVAAIREVGDQVTSTLVELAKNGRFLDAWQLYRSAVKGVRVRNYGSAIRNLGGALEKKSDYPEAWLLLGELCLELGRVTDARDALALCQKYAQIDERREESRQVELAAIDHLLLIERILGNEAAEIDLGCLKWERGFKLKGDREVFLALRGRLRRVKRRRPTKKLTKDLQRELPRLLRENTDMGVVAATHKDFAFCRPHLGDIERYGSWVFIFGHLHAILTHILCRDPIIGPDDDRRRLAGIIGRLLAYAPDEFEHGLPLPEHRDKYDHLFRRRGDIQKTLKNLHTTGNIYIEPEDLRF